MNNLAEQLTTSETPALRGRINALEAEMLKQPQLNIEPKHYFAKGIYAREITIPAGTLLTGKIHKTEQLNIISKGRLTVVTEDGGEQMIEAPYTLVSPPGTKRIAFVHEETVWTTIHGTEETDLVKLEQMLIAPSFEALENEDKKWLGSDQQ